MVDGVVSDVLRQVGEELKNVDKKFASQVRKAVRAAVTEGGADIASKIKAEASFSSRIPAAVYVRPNFSKKSAGVRVVVNRRKAPHARVLEMGNHDASPSRDFFYHPVFGRKREFGILTLTPVTKQKKREFFFKAVRAREAATEQIFSDAIDKALREVGFR